MGDIDPDHIDNDAYKEEGGIVFLEDEGTSLKSPKPKDQSPIAIVHQFIQRSAERAVQNHLARVYACLMSPPNADPDNIPTVATAAAAAVAMEDIVPTALSYGGEGDDVGDNSVQNLELGIGDDEFVAERNVDQYNEFGII